jgi:hypothetical protein
MQPHGGGYVVPGQRHFDGSPTQNELFDRCVVRAAVLVTVRVSFAEVEPLKVVLPP